MPIFSLLPGFWTSCTDGAKKHLNFSGIYQIAPFVQKFHKFEEKKKNGRRKKKAFLLRPILDFHPELIDRCTNGKKNY